MSSPQFMNNKRMSIKNHNAVLLFSQQPPLPKPNINAHLLIFGIFLRLNYQSQQPKRSRNTKMKNNIPSFPLKRFWQQPLVIVNTSKITISVFALAGWLNIYYVKYEKCVKIRSEKNESGYFDNFCRRRS